MSWQLHTTPPNKTWSKCNATQCNTTQHNPPLPSQCVPNPMQCLGHVMQLNLPQLIHLAATTCRDTLNAQHSQQDRGWTQWCDWGMGQLRSLRSRSLRDRSPTISFQKQSLEKKNQLSACPICLSKKPHQIQKYQATHLWDGQCKVRCHRADNGRNVDKKGCMLCSNWNQTIRCKDKSAHHIHECSGCGDLLHGA